MKLLLPVLFAIPLLAVAACGKANSPSSQSDTSSADPSNQVAASFEEALLAWESADAAGIFSLGFSDDPPEGIYVSGISYLDKHPDSCAVFEEDNYLQASSPHDNWVMLLHLSEASTGRFDVFWDDEFGGPPSTQIMIKHIAQGVELERHTALAGSVTVTEVPGDIAAWGEGVELELSGTVEFSTSEDESLGCVIAGDDDQEPTDVLATCECSPASGEIYSCEERVNEVSCCIDTDAPRRVFSFTMRAVQCAAVCTAVGLLYFRYCAEL